MAEMKNVALVGLGTIGTIHLRHLIDLQKQGLLRIAGLADPKPSEAARNLAESIGVNIRESHRDLLADKSIDGFIVATPTKLHSSITRELIENAPVLVEKPIAASIGEAREMIEAGRKSGNLLRVGHAERFNPAFIHALDRLDKVGELVSISSWRHNPFPEGRAPMGDVVLDLGSHDIDLVEKVLSARGKSLRDAELSAIGGSSARTPTTFLDNVQVFGQVENTAVHISTSWVDAERIRRMEIVGNKGKLVIDLFAREVELFPNVGGYDPADSDAMMRFAKYGRREIAPLENVDVWPIESEQRAFVKELNEENTNLATPEEALLVLEVALKAGDIVRSRTVN